ncbi:hypothetical protein T484DRAFT_1805502 [Baffinella frigidus]|nr:hypothetical protein T484DRAFT_1805502 [Cryptophyta sp. CCMP2293]
MAKGGLFTHLFLSLLLGLLACSLATSPCVPFWTAAAMGDVEELRTQVLAGQHINARSENGRSALMQAALMGEAGSIRFLLDEGAHASAWDKNTESSALSLAEMMRAERKTEREGKGRSWKQLNPKHLDFKLLAYSEIVELLKKAEGCEAPREQEGQAAEPSDE